MLRLYLLTALVLVFTVGLGIAARNWRHSQTFRDEGLVCMALSSLGFLLTFQLAG